MEVTSECKVRRRINLCSLYWEMAHQLSCMQTHLYVWTAAMSSWASGTRTPQLSKCNSREGWALAESLTCVRWERPHYSRLKDLPTPIFSLQQWSTADAWGKCTSETAQLLLGNGERVCCVDCRASQQEVCCHMCRAVGNWSKLKALKLLREGNCNPSHCY